MQSSRVLVSLLIIVVVCFSAGGMFLVHSHNAPVQNAATAEIIKTGLEGDHATDPQAYRNYQDAIRLLLAQQNYEELDRLANSARANKERFPGGGRKLTAIYTSFEDPDGADNASDAAWTEMLNRLERWKKLSANPLTPTLALAGAYNTYAFVGRGDGYANTVTAAQWDLYHDRLAKAQALLEEVADQKNDDPMWYDAMLTAATEADPVDQRALFEAAIAYDPTYRRYYRKFASSLRPEWNGKPGDIVRFANEMYERLGPINGPIEYFDIAAFIICNCGPQSEIKRFSLTRIKQGYALSVLNYGESTTQLNQMAFIAWQKEDPVALDDALARIGYNWDPSGWTDDRKNFESAQAWLASFRIGGEPFDAVDEEMKTQEGQNYAKLIQADFDRKYSKLLDDCRKDVGDDLRGFYFYFKQDGTGKLSTAMGYPMNAMGACFHKNALQDKPTFIAPPHAGYWNKIVVRDH